MKKKTALLLAIVMLMAMPMSAFAMSADEATQMKVYNDIMRVNNGQNAAIVILSDSGALISSVRFNAAMYPDNDGDGFPDVEIDMATGQITNAPTADVPYFTVSSAAITSSGALSADYATTSIPLDITAPYNPATKTQGLPTGGTYAVTFTDESDNVVWVGYGFTGSLAAGASTGTVNGRNQKGEDDYAGYDVAGTKAYYINVYALSSTPTLHAPFTLSEFKAAISNNVIASQLFKVTYKK